MNIEEIKKADVYSEQFLTVFHAMLEKFVKEYDDMAQMEVIKQASKLLAVINEN